MSIYVRRFAIAGLVLATRAAAADPLGHDRIRAHVAALERAKLERASHVAFSLRALVPIYGSATMESTVFGGVRPTGVAVDWILGGAVPAGLAIAALATDDRHARSILAWSALGLYATTRLAILVVGNLHMRAYNHAIDLRLATESPGVALALHW